MYGPRRFGSVLRSHFSVRKLERFMHVRLDLRRLHLHYLPSPLARLSRDYLSRGSHGDGGVSLYFWCAGCLFGREFMVRF